MRAIDRARTSSFGWTEAEEATTSLFGRIGVLKGVTPHHATAHEDRSAF
jgi:hypothetical protein